MDRIFAHTVDQIALLSPSAETAISLHQVATIVLNHPPRPAQLRYLATAFRARQHLFSSPDWSAPPHLLHLHPAPALATRALGHSVLEHPPLPPQACLILRLVGHAGPSGVLQSDLAAQAKLKPVMISHYLGTLSARRLVARKKVVLTTTRPALCSTDLPSTNVTFTAVIVLARYAPFLADADAAHPKTTASDQRARPPKTVADVNVERGVERVMAALTVPPYVRTQRDLKVICLPDNERPEACPKELYQRRRHRSFRAVRVRLQRLGLVTVVDRKCIDVMGKFKGVLTCLQLVNIPEQAEVPLPLEGSAAAPVVVKTDDVEEVVFDEEEDVREDTCRVDSTTDANGDIPNTTTDDVRPVLPPIHDAPDFAKGTVPDLPSVDAPSVHYPQETDTGAHFLAEVDLLEQIYQLLRKSGSQGISVPEIAAYLDGGTGLTGAPAKRVRNIINGIKRRVPIVESQCFEGSAMHLKICLAEFSDMDGILPSDRKTAVAKMSMTEQGRKQSRRNGKSELARKKNELTSLGLQRKELVARLLEDRKAIVIETLGKEIAQMENTGLYRVDQKVMRRIINELVLEKRANVITTKKPSIKESSRWQTIRLVVLPDLDESSSEVIQAIKSMVARALYGNQEGAVTPQKRTADSDEVVVTLGRKRERATPKEPKSNEPKSNEPKSKEPKSTKRKRRRTTSARKPRKASKPVKSPEQVDEPTAKELPKEVAKVIETGATEAEKARENVENASKNVEIVPKVVENAPKVGDNAAKEPVEGNVVVRTKLRNTEKALIARLRAMDFGLLKGRMARLRSFHKRLYDNACNDEATDEESTATVQHSTMEAARTAKCLQSFTIFSCLKEFTVAEYAATVGIYQEHGDIIDTIAGERIADVIDILQEELQTDHAARQIRTLVQGLVRLGLMESTKDAKWKLCGAGIIRDFGKGFASGVSPHGIIFSSRKAVEVYWTELEQFAYYRFVGTVTRNYPDKQHLETSEDGSLQPVADVYVRSKWSTGLEQAFLHSEQIEYEAMLQEIVGVKVIRDSSGALSTSNFVVTPLKRLTASEIFNYVHRSCRTEMIKKDRERASKTVERLLYYARYRSENMIPHGICKEADSVGEAPDGSLTTPRSRNRPILSLRISRGLASVPAALLKNQSRSSRPTLGKRLSSYNSELRRKIAQRKKPQQEVLVDVKKCVSMLQAIIQQRAVTFCRKGGDAPRWKASTLFSSMETGQGTRADKAKIKDEEAENGEAVQFKHTMVAVCESAVVQGVVDIMALRMSLQLAEDRVGTSKAELYNLCEESRSQLGSIDSVLVAGMLESEKDLQKSYGLVLKLDGFSSLRLRDERLKVLEDAFHLGSSMRFHQEYSFSQQLSILIERHRRLLKVKNGGKLWHGLIFRDKGVDEIMSPGDEDAEEVRTELMEQVLILILQSGANGQVEGDMLDILSRFRRKDVTEARDNLIIRGVISVSMAKDGQLLFRMNTPEKNEEREAEILQAWKVGERRTEWVEDLMQRNGSVEKDGYSRLMSTKLGKAACNKSGLESLAGTMMGTQLVFYQGPKDRKLDLRASVGPENQESLAVMLDEDGNEEGKEEKSTFSMDIQFQYKPVEIEQTGRRRGSICVDVNENGNRGQVMLQEKLQNLVKDGGYRGVTLWELLESKVVQSCKDDTRVAKALYVMLEKGLVERLCIETNTLASSADDAAWNKSNGVLYLWHTHAKMLQSKGKTADGATKTLNVWHTAHGMPNEELAATVSATVMDIVSRSPGIAEWRVVREVLTRLIVVPGRAVSDVVFGLVRRGRLRRMEGRRFGGGIGPFARAKWEMIWLKIGNGFCERFVDGEAIRGGFNDTGLQVMAGGMRKISAVELSAVGCFLW